MITITAVVRAQAGAQDRVRAALLRCAEEVRADEPGTLGYFVSQDLSDPRRFTTCEQRGWRAWRASRRDRILEARPASRPPCSPPWMPPSSSPG